ncbi:ankyrin repeat-containing protein At5g02620-like [Pistacia vera]|uniref:ankyrin repeat-containing protein At5g02620-like n=1 Tax=Pistacia vera TaxID=55513 RepID=UPI001263817E|nr:ankyrin repeat-containing protein At5g02620-like [Pistacia vera]
MGKIGVIKIFLNATEQISRTKDNEDNTPLHNAVRNHNRKLAFMLINKDPEPIQYLNKANQSPLSIAIDAQVTHIACLMINKNPSSHGHRGTDGLTLLHRAVINQDYVVMVEILQAKKELINELDAHNRNPLHFAAAIGNSKMVRHLANEDDSLVYQGDRDGLTPIHLAAKNGQIVVLKMLIEFYPDVFELLENKKRNILHVAAENGQADIVKYILALPELEDLINSPDADGNTPLHLAAIKFRNYVIYILSTSPRVNISGTNNGKKTALEIAQSSGDHGDMSKAFMSSFHLRKSVVAQEKRM